MASDNYSGNSEFSTTPWENDFGFDEVQHLTYTGEGGLRDWALYWPGTGDTCVVAIHGHGSTGDQLFTRADIRDAWLPAYREFGLGVLSVNLRGNAWMSEAAVHDLHRLLKWVRAHKDVRRFLFISGSMGGTSNLIYAVRHPEDVAALVALCPATDIGQYAQWCAARATGIIGEINAAIVAAYGGTPDEQPERYAAHSAVQHAARLTMPALVIHGDNDATIPVEEARRLATAMEGRENFSYVEMPGGHHDSPLMAFDVRGWLARFAETQ